MYYNTCALPLQIKIHLNTRNFWVIKSNFFGELLQVKKLIAKLITQTDKMTGFFKKFTYLQISQKKWKLGLKFI